MATRRTPASKPRAKSTAEAAPTKPAQSRRAPSKPKSSPPPRATVTPDMRRGMIAEGAFLRAERRGFAPGHEDEDWLSAEAEVDKLLSADPSAPQ